MFRVRPSLEILIDCGHCMVLAALLAGLTATSTGCATVVDMSQHQGGGPHTVISYTGVRADAGRFEDYSVIDGSVLEAR